MSLVNLDTVEVASASPCKTLDQVFQTPARRLVGRVCRNFLDQNCITASELVCHPPYQQRMSQDAQEMQRAVQMLSAAQARIFNLDLHKRMRHLFKMIDAVNAALEALYKRLPSVDFEPGGLTSYYHQLREIVNTDELEMAFCVVLTRNLHDAKSWESRLEKLLSFIEVETDIEVQNHIDSFVADLIDSPAALRTMMGSRRLLAERISELIGLYRGNFSQTDTTEAWPLAERLNRALSKFPMPHSRLSLKLQILRAMESGTPVSRQTGAVELLALCDLLEELQEEDGAIIGGDSMEKEITTRLSRQVSHDSLEILLDDHETLHARLELLLTLRQRLIGAGNIKQINEYIRYQFERRTFKEELLKAGEGVSGRMLVVADLWRTIADYDFPEGMRDHFLDQLEAIQLEF